MLLQRSEDLVPFISYTRALLSTVRRVKQLRVHLKRFTESHLCFLVAQMVKHPPAMQETRVLSLGQQDPLEQEMTTHSSILAWRISWTEEPDGLQSVGSPKSQTQLSN